MAMRWLCALLLALPGAAGDCQQPPRFSFAEPPLPLEPSYAAGTKLRYTCRPGYTVGRGKSTLVTCNPNSTWSAHSDFCIGKSCGPPDFMNGDFNPKTNLLFGSTIIFTCDLGYRLVGKSSAECVLSGSGVSWDAVPFCEIIPCLPPPEIKNGQVSGGNRDFIFGMSVTYSCNKGFSLIGNDRIYCTTVNNLDGVWSGAAPECKIVSCKNPEVPNGRRLSGFGTVHTYKNTVTFECNPGYSLNGSDLVTCEADNAWKPPLPTCDRIYCGPAPHFPFAELGTAAAERYAAGTELRYQCKPGYTAARGKSSAVTCLDDRSWSSEPDFCVRQQCAPPEVQNGEVIAENFLFETVVRFTCHEGYELKGASSAMCVVSGGGVAWDPAPPHCDRQLCGEPPRIANGMHNGTKGTDFVRGSVVVYTCKKGFTLAGAASVHCQVDDQNHGVWSKPTPECRGGANIIIAGSLPLLLAMLIVSI